MKKRQNFRGERLGEEIRRIVSELLLRELKDPAFDGMISISYVKSTHDGSFATIYFTASGGDDEAALEGFEKAKGFIRNEISRRLGIRRAPDLRFKADEAERYGQRIDAILDQLDLPADSKTAGQIVSFDEISEIIDAYERYLVFTHIHMDGDTLGSAVAFADAMREIGREALVVVGEEPPRTLNMIDLPFVLSADKARQWLSEKDADKDENAPYLSIAMDFADSERLEGREELFHGAAATLCIDHHITSGPACDFNYIEPDAAATAEIVFRLLKRKNLPVSERIATALYIGIVTDTGRFQYTNTTSGTHRIAADLMEAGADFTTAYREIFQSVRAEKLYVQSAMLNTLDIFADGKAALAYVNADTLKRLNASGDETDGMSEVMRSIIGVEVSAFLRECENGKIKVSMRSKDWLDVAALAAEFGGGGHIRAAGFTIDLSMEEITAQLKEKLIRAFEL